MYGTFHIFIVLITVAILQTKHRLIAFKFEAWTIPQVCGNFVASDRSGKWILLTEPSVVKQAMMFCLFNLPNIF